jgi:voltage-gated potassium channel
MEYFRSRFRDYELMRSNRIHKLLQSNPLAIPIILVVLIVIFGGIGMYLAEYKHPGSNITTLGDAFWWAIETITTVGYGDYIPVTLVGRVIAVIVMFAGIGIVVTLVGIISQTRIKKMESRLKEISKEIESQNIDEDKKS